MSGANELDRFCSTTYPKLVGALSIMYGDADLAEDLAQDALSRAVERWDHIRGMDDPESYVIRIGFNLARSWWRRRFAERRAHSRLGPASSWSQSDPVPNLEVRRILATLTPRQREAIVHRFYLELDVRETAAAMRCAEGTVRALTAQGIATLRSAGLGADDG
ncbi:MAG: sigma-70 family RNA polymerase sigma factor [Ilumatobacteraceae bacterium]